MIVGLGLYVHERQGGGRVLSRSVFYIGHDTECLANALRAPMGITARAMQRRRWEQMFACPALLLLISHRCVSSVEHRVLRMNEEVLNL